MEEKVYSVRIYRILTELFWGLVGSAVIAWISSIWLSGYQIYLTGILVYILHIVFVMSDSFMSIKVTDGNLIITQRNKIKHCFRIQECGFEAKTKSSCGDTECKLVVITPNGERTSIDCDLLGERNFYKLCEDLHIVGENAYVHELKTVKK